MNTTIYLGAVQHAPTETNSNHEMNRFLFSGYSTDTGEEYQWSFRVIRLHGFPSPEQFGNDVDTSGNVLSGELCLEEPERIFGRFSYRRPDGSNATADADQGQEYHFPGQDRRDISDGFVEEKYFPLPPLRTPKRKPDEIEFK